MKAKYPFFSRYPDISYLDNASTTHKPQSVLDALNHFYTDINANIGRGTYELAEQATVLYEAVRKKVAHFIGAEHAKEVVFTRGTTDSINMVASCWAEQHIQAGDEVLISELEHHSNCIVWQQLTRKKGALLRFIPVDEKGNLDLSCLDKYITFKTKLVCVTHISNAIGTVVDVAAIIAAAKKVGARVLIDAAQSVGHRSINVAQLGCDFLAFSGHKMGGPTGVGVLYVKQELHEQMQPTAFGGGMVQEVSFEHATWLEMPYRLEAGTPAIAQVIGLGASIDHIKTIDLQESQQREMAFIEHIKEWLALKKGFVVVGDPGKSHIISFYHISWHPHDLAAFLDSRGIFVRAGVHCAQPLAQKLGYAATVRVSLYHYTDSNDIQKLIAALNEVE